MILTEYVTFSGELVCLSGLRIGGAGGQLAIGSVENTLLRNPVTGEPYIPGSSLKGRMRSLLEAQQQNYKWERDRQTGRFNKEPQDDSPCGCGQCLVCRIFGPYQNTNHKLGPTRLLVRDLPLTDESRLRLADDEKKGVGHIEEKTENMVKRNTGTAVNPRTSERVWAAAFRLQLTLRVFEGDNRATLIDAVEKALGNVRNQGIGSSMSRGYGEVDVRPVPLPYTVQKVADVRLSTVDATEQVAAPGNP